eukprot:PhF_6_TR43608/c0_g1_i2/m.66982
MAYCFNKFDLFLEISLYLDIREVLLMGSTNTLTYGFLMKDPEETVWTNLYNRDFPGEEYSALTRNNGIVTIKEVYIDAFQEAKEGLTEIAQLTHAIVKG